MRQNEDSQTHQMKYFCLLTYRGIFLAQRIATAWNMPSNHEEDKPLCFFSCFCSGFLLEFDGDLKYNHLVSLHNDFLLDIHVFLCDFPVD